MFFKNITKQTLATVLVCSWSLSALAEPVIFESTQLSPAEESAKMRTVILKDFPEEVAFEPNDNQFRSGNHNVSLLGGMHSDFTSEGIKGTLDDLSTLLPDLNDQKISPALLELGKAPDGKQHYIPWMQATYLMAANRKALKYLPAGADINHLSYDQLVAWGKAINDATGQPRIGLPIGGNGLIHRFVQGYLLPAYTGGTVRGFASAEAVQMWTMTKQLWQYVTPKSMDYSEMADALLNNDAWVVWDHTARIKKAFEKRPEDFVAFPAPAGPKGRAFMAVVAGLAIVKDAPKRKSAEHLLAYLTQPDIQVTTLNETGFFPVVTVGEAANQINPALRALQDAVSQQASANDALPVLLPTGLGEKNGEFSTAFKLTFSQIVIRGQAIEKVLARQSMRLRALLAETGATCWQPDAPSEGPCPIN